MSERACTRHYKQPPYEAEVIKLGKRFDEVMLRCPECHRPQGVRLVPVTSEVES
jgi:hypothetical protein